MDESELRLLQEYKLNKGYFEAEKKFSQLPLKQKVQILLSHRPRIFQIETTTKCNLNCPLCSTHNLKRGRLDLDIGILKRIVKANPQIRYVTLHLMGEPLMATDLFNEIKYLKEHSVFTFFSTNGMLLKEKVDDILNSKLDKISISLDATTQEELELYRKGANLERIVSGIKELVQKRNERKTKRPIIQIQSLMFGYNELKEEELVRRLWELRPDRVKLKTVSTNSFGAKNPKIDDIQWEKLIPQKYLRDETSFIKYKDRAVCRMLFQGFVLADGTVVPCCIDYDGEYAFGNITTQTWDQIYHSNSRKAFLVDYFEGNINLCKSCSMGYEYSWYPNTIHSPENSQKLFAIVQKI